MWRIPDVENKWNVSHRYSDFAQLHAALKVGVTTLPTLPPKKVFGNTDRDFINERRVALQVVPVAHFNVWHVELNEEKLCFYFALCIQHLIEYNQVLCLILKESFCFLNFKVPGPCFEFKGLFSLWKCCIGCIWSSVVWCNILRCVWLWKHYVLYFSVICFAFDNILCNLFFIMR